MASYEHQMILRALKRLDERPESANALAQWMRAEGHLSLLRENALSDEIILLGSTPKIAYVHAVLVPETDVASPNPDDLLEWSSTPFEGRAGYQYTIVQGNAKVEYCTHDARPTKLLTAQQLVFGRQRNDLEDDPVYYELLQEFTHFSDIHWRSDRHAYCGIDQNGDIEAVVSVTKRDKSEPITLITCKRKTLELFLATSGKVLLRFYDFIMIKPGEFDSWKGGVKRRTTERDDLFYDQCIHPKGHAYTRGAQIVRCITPKQDLFRSLTDPPFRKIDRQYASFIIKEWRNEMVTEVSTDPDHTRNYFEAKNNALPFELSAAFFRPEVLTKYKADRDKYTVNEPGCHISCRGTWELKSYGVNEAGQVHAYICDLRTLPYQEQMYWRSYNEEPKGDISNRAYENDFLGEVASETTPLEDVYFTLTRWSDSNLDWWQIPDVATLLRVNTPIASNRDEWADAILELTQVTVEKFRPMALSGLMDQQGIEHARQRDGSLALLEKLLAADRIAVGKKIRLDALREAQRIRTKVRAHSGGTEAAEISRDALQNHGTYRAHFERLCERIAEELKEIEGCLSQHPIPTPNHRLGSSASASSIAGRSYPSRDSSR